MDSKHLPFDYDNDFCLPDTSLPHMMPTEAGFNASAQKLGLNNEDLIIVYDNSGTLASPRAWWMLKAMGHENVKVLNGGLPAWIEAGVACRRFTRKPEQLGNFAGKLNKMHFGRKCSIRVLKQLQCILLMLAHERAFGEVPEPREGLRSGHIPNSLCLPFKNCWITVTSNRTQN